jgi:hypothetical protein
MKTILDATNLLLSTERAGGSYKRFSLLVLPSNMGMKPPSVDPSNVDNEEELSSLRFTEHRALD